ncbi:MAG: hypothetical protein WDZ70_01075 [Candidatus Paceibacterota bacterium]
MSTKRTIGFDLDDVLLNFFEALQIFHNNKYDTNYRREHITSYYIDELWGCEPDEATQRILEFYQSEAHQNAVPVEGSIEAVKKLSSTNELIIITSKPEDLRELTKRWLDEYFPNIFDDIYFTNHFAGSGEKRPKGEMCKQCGVDVFIDDALVHARSVAEIGIPVLLFDTPWNQEKISPPITRVHSWEEAVAILEEK